MNNSQGINLNFVDDHYINHLSGVSFLDFLRALTSMVKNGSMEKNLAVHSSKLRPKQLKKAQVKTTQPGPSHSAVMPYVQSEAINSSSTLSCLPPR